MIKTDIKVTGADLFAKQLKQYPERADVEIVKALKQSARETAVQLGYATAPFGDKEKSADKLKGRIAADVGRLFPSTNNPNRIYQLLSKADPRIARAYWQAYKAGDTEQMAKVLRRRGIPRGLDAGKHQAARVKGRVPGAAEPIAVAPAGRQAAYIKRAQKKRGIAKAGWFVAAKSIGGRVRGRSGKQKFPAYVRVHGRRSGLGGAMMRLGAGRGKSITIWNTVSYIGEALPEARLQVALDKARIKFRSDMLKGLAAQRRRTFRRAA